MLPQPAAARIVYDIPDFCATYRVSRTTTYEEIKTGKLKVRKIGRATRIASEDAEAWFAACIPEREHPSRSADTNSEPDQLVQLTEGETRPDGPPAPGIGSIRTVGNAKRKGRAERDAKNAARARADDLPEPA